ncbi:MAG: hemolysin XhlA family protein [Luteimonas sp.]|nr:hemolysin XhlA family protein [Luteimonas sp.]
MSLNQQHRTMVRMLGVALVASVAFSGCATYKDDFARIDSRLDSIDSRVQGAAQSAESANQSAQQANRRLDALEGRVQQIESAPRRVPRG